MHRCIRLAALALVLVLLAPGAARATVSSSVRIRWDGARPAPAQVGVEYTGRFRITASGGGVLEDVRLDGTGWTVTSLSNPGRVALASRASRVIEFRAVPTDPAQPLFLRATFDGRPVEQSIRLDALSLERAGKRGRVAFADGGPRLVGKRVGPTTNGQLIRFHGQFAYVRDGGPTLGADNLPIRIMDDDSPDPFDEEIWVGRTDPDGNFDVTIEWDDCDIGCDEPDIYLEVDCANGDVSVHADDIFGTLYGWSTEDQIIENFEGNEVNFGTMMPDDPSEYAAPHIYTSIVRAHRYSSTHGGMAPGNVIVLWPDNDDPTKYNPDAEVIHIAPVRTWNEISHGHEFGHHLQNVFGTLVPPQYTTHSRWCQMTATTDAWQEGWANYFGALAAEDYPATYGVQPWVSIAANNEDRWAFDGVKPCTAGGPLHNATLTEGFVDALLRDIRDANDPASPDDHDGGATDCDMDAMALGDDEIFTVFRDDDPATVLQFIQKFRDRYELHDQDLWSTARNISALYSFSLPAPDVISQPTACSIVRPGETITLNVQGNGSLLRYQWRWNGTPLTDFPGSNTGSLTPNLTLGPITATMGGTYDCVVTTCDGTLTVTSAPSRITVDAPPTPNPLLSWGENWAGQIGDGTTNNSRPAFPYTHLINAVQADAGRAFTVALLANGSVWTWGTEQWGELGNGGSYTSTQSTPAAVPSLADIVQIASGKYCALALQRNGNVAGWGFNFYGTLALGTSADRNVPTIALFPGCVRAIAAGEQHSVALLADGTVWTSGYNGPYGSLGTGQFDGWSTTPVQVVGLTNVVDVKAAAFHTLALRADGTVWAWGANHFGTLGDATTTPRATPVQVAVLTGVRSIATTEYNSFAIRTNGECYSWGQNISAGHGNAGGTSVTPQLMASLTGLDVRKIDGGNSQWGMALLGNGRLKVWGTNVQAGGSDVGIFNSTTPLYSVLPIDVPNVHGVSGFAAGWSTVHAYGTVMAADAPTVEGLPLEYALRASPNPARARATVAFDLPVAGAVTLSVCDVAGRRVRSLVAEARSAGRHAVTWDGRAESGAPTAAGVYFLRLEVGGRVLNRPLVRLD